MNKWTSRRPDYRKAAGHPAMRSQYSPGDWVTHRLFPGRFELVRHQGLGEWAARHETEAQGTARNNIQEQDFSSLETL